MEHTRATTQKEQLESLLTKQKEHFTSTDFLKEAHKQNNKISRATIFRFLKNLKKQNKITAFTCNRQQLYTTSHHNHWHYTCERCGEKYHLKMTDISSLTKQLPGSLCHITCEIYGICTTCKKKND